MSGRNSALRGNSIVLSAQFLDAGGNYTDPTDLKISVYPVGNSPEDPDTTTSDAWVYNVTTSSGGSGPLADESRLIIRISEGKFTFTFPIPDDSDLGAAFDRWEGIVDSEELDATFSFTIVGGGSVGTTQLYNNNAVYLTISKYIYALDGSHMSDDYNAYFTTAYTPMYSSIRRVRLDLGRFIANVPDDTINLAIFEAGLVADANCYNSIVNSNIFNVAKREYTTCLAELTLAKALLGDSSISEKLYKSLADFSVSRGGLSDSLKDAIDKFEDCVVRWEITLQTGGDLAPGQSLRPRFSVKGALAEDRIMVSRVWEPSSGIGMGDSAANSEKPYTSRRALRTFKSRGRG